MENILLSGKQAVFVAEYVANELAGGKLTDYEVALRAGVAKSNASKYASLALADAKIQAAIVERRKTLAQLAVPDVDAVRVLREWATIALGDPTAIVKARRLNCRHCWGVDFHYQRTDQEYASETVKALDRGDDMGFYHGGPGFRITRDPNPDCPECDGEGLEDVYIADFRKLKPEQRRLIAGVKQGKHGIEVQFRDQDAALKLLAQHLGLLVERKELTGKDGGPIQTANVNYALPSDPVEAARAYQRLMEGN